MRIVSSSPGMARSETFEGGAGGVCTWCRSIWAGVLSRKTGWPVNAQYAVHASE